MGMLEAANARSTTQTIIGALDWDGDWGQVGGIKFIAFHATVISSSLPEPV